MNKLLSCFRVYCRDKAAATAVEYGLLVAFIAIFIMAAVLSIGDYLQGYYNTLLDYILSVQ